MIKLLNINIGNIEINSVKLIDEDLYILYNKTEYDT